MSSPAQSSASTSLTYTVSFSFDPTAQDTSGGTGFIELPPSSGSYYVCENPAAPNPVWTPIGLSPTPFQAGATFSVDLSSKTDGLTIAWSVACVPVPSLNPPAAQSPFTQQVFQNASGIGATSSGAADSCGYYHYTTLYQQPLVNTGSFLFAIYFTIVSGVGAGRVYSIDPEMEVSDTN